jgi:hypothetical protein
VATTPDYPILGPPRITAAGFADVLRSNGSPAAGESAACYQAFIASGVDPAVGLALFRKESTYGKFGLAHANRSWGNIRGGAGYPLDSGHFRIYPTWTVGAQDAARLLTVYGRNQIRPGTITSTVRTFPYVWAPSSDGNAPASYGASLATWIGQWQSKYLPGGPGSYTPPSATLTAATGTFADFQAKLASLGIPNNPDHVLTHDEVAKYVAQVLQIKGDIAQTAIDKFTGHTVQWWWDSQGMAGLDPLGAVNGVVNGLPDVIAAIPQAITNGLITVAELAAILALIVLGLYLVAKSQGVAPGIPIV